MRVPAFLLALTTAASAQVLQSGNVTPGHPVRWITNGVIGDAGVPTAGLLSGIGVTVSGQGICQNSGSQGAPYNQLCLDVKSTGASIDFTSIAGATGGLNFNVNGAIYPFPFSIGGILGPASSTLGDVVCWNNTAGTLVSDCGFAVTAGAANKLALWTSATALGSLATANNSVLTTGAGGVPAWATTLPSGLTLPSPTVTGTLTAPDSGTWASGGISGTSVNSTPVGAGTPSTGAFTTLSASGTANFTGTFQIAGHTMTFPGVAATLPSLAANNAFTGNNTYSGTTAWTGSLTVPVRSAAAATVTVSATTDYFLCLDPTSTAIAVDLPATPATGTTYLIKDCTGQAATHNITVTPSSGNIDGGSTSVMSTNYQSEAVTYTGSQWSIN